MANIRVLRLLEYLYDDFETMEKDMARWGVKSVLAYPTNVDARDVKVRIRSTTLPPTTLLAPLPSKFTRCPWASAAGSCEHSQGHEGKHSFEENK